MRQIPENAALISSGWLILGIQKGILQNLSNDLGRRKKETYSVWWPLSGVRSGEQHDGRHLVNVVELLQT